MGGYTIESSRKMKHSAFLYVNFCHEAEMFSNVTVRVNKEEGLPHPLILIRAEIADTAAQIPHGLGRTHIEAQFVYHVEGFTNFRGSGAATHDQPV